MVQSKLQHRIGEQFSLEGKFKFLSLDTSLMLHYSILHTFNLSTCVLCPP